MAGKMKILFLCTGNSCRSQMAEAWARHLKGHEFEVHSAGVEPKGVDPRAVKAMAEAGIDISGHKSKEIDALGGWSLITSSPSAIMLVNHAPFFPPRLGSFTRVLTIHPGWQNMRKVRKGPWCIIGG